jgi:imidazolonepropionase-like amidohydrolase
MGSPVTIIRGARVFDGEHLTTATTVAMSGDRIADVRTEAVETATSVELGDVTLLPGLVDCHQHLCFDGVGELHDQVRDLDDEELATRAHESAVRAVRGGVTTVRDLGDRSYVTLAMRDSAGLPRILASGPPITRPGGHCWYLGGECSGVDDLRRAVDERAERGCDVVKVMVSGGFKTSTHPVWESQFTAEEVRAVVERAHEHGLPVAAHCHGIAAIELAVDAAVDTIEHCTFMDHETRCAPPPELLRRLAESGIVASVTLGRAPDPRPLPPFITSNLDALRTSRRMIRELGGTIVVGTDAGIDVAKLHDVLPYAMDELMLGGMTAIEALSSMTGDAARAIGLGDRVGRLLPGFDADVVAVNGDPTTDPAALTSIAAVWRAGVRIV